MYILLEAITPHGATANTHRVRGVEIAETVKVYINSFATPDAGLLVWQDTHEMPMLEMSNGIYPMCVYNWLVSPTGPFAGGQLLDDPSDFELKRAKLLNGVKSKRDSVIASGCSTAAGVVDTDDVSLRNIMATYQTAVLALMTNNPYSVSWRMRDNSLVTLDAQQMIAIGNAVLQRVEATYQRSWELKEEIENSTAETIDSVLLMEGWPE